MVRTLERVQHSRPEPQDGHAGEQNGEPTEDAITNARSGARTVARLYRDLDDEGADSRS